MHFDNQTVSSGSNGCLCHRLNQLAAAGSVARVGNNRQVAQALKHRNCRQVKRITGIGFEGTDTALAQHDITVASGQNVFSRVQKLIVGRAEAAFEQHRAAAGSELAQQIKILHIACAYLQNICMLRTNIHVLRSHNLSDSQQAMLLTGFCHHSQAFNANALEAVWTGPRLKCAAAQYLPAGGLNKPGDLIDLFR
ncbi:hypothetical protein D3C75_344490 [compost metagenome]